jgi:hypothetical protein
MVTIEHRRWGTPSSALDTARGAPEGMSLGEGDARLINSASRPAKR